MKILYKKILNLELWHDYYLGQPDPPQSLSDDYDISDMFALVPTPDCDRILRNLRWRFRPQRRGATIFAEVEPVDPQKFRTKSPIDRPYQLTFRLVVRDPRFANFTNLPFVSLPAPIYYFSNLSGNQQGNTLFLTRSLPSYQRDQADRYRVGQLVTHGNRTWEALRDRVTDSDAPDPDDWESLPASQYVSPQDQLPRQDSSYSYFIPQASPGEVLRFTLMNVNQQKVFEYEFMVPESHKEEDSIAIALNFPTVPVGRYQLLFSQGTEVESREFVLADPRVDRDAWGLVEIVLNPNLVSSAFSLLRSENGQTLIQPQTYVIRFKNRATYWRYRYERPHGFTKEILQTHNLQYKNDKTYFTQRPQGLLQRPSRFFKDGNDHLLPAPRVAQIKPEPIDSDTQIQKETIAIFSDIYL